MEYESEAEMSVAEVDHPFLRFPQEVWEAIFDQAEHTGDIWTVLRTFSELDAAFQNRKTLWLFELLIPILVESSQYLEERDLLNCRHVCRQWSNGIAKYLGSQPVFEACKDKEDSEHCIRKDLLEANQYEVLLTPTKKQYYGGTCFSNADLIDKFLGDHIDYPIEQNPIVSRILHIRTANLDAEDNIRRIWQGAVDLVERFGDHIRFLEVECMHNNLPLSETLRDGIWNQFVKILAKLPRLKYMRLSLGPTFFSSVASLPILPQLETLEIASAVGLQLMNSLLPQYHSHIRRLEMELSMWRSQYSDYFANLTELKLTSISPKNKHLLQDLLQAIHAPSLIRLQLGFKDLAAVKLGINDLFQWTKRYLHLQSLHVAGENIMIEEPRVGNLNPRESLTYLKIQDSYALNYNFLIGLPSLQHLFLKVNDKPNVVDYSVTNALRIREQIETGKMYESNVWEVLPKLKTVTLQGVKTLTRGRRFGTNLEFDRATYEHWKRIGYHRQVTPNLNHNNLRQDILQFLYNNANRQSAISLSHLAVS